MAAPPWRSSTSAPTAGSPRTSSTPSHLNRRPTRSSRAALCTARSTASTASDRAAIPAPARLARPPGSSEADELLAEARRRARAGPPSRRAGDRPPGRAAAGALPWRRSPSARRAASSPGCWRRRSASGRAASDRRWRSTAGACTGRSTGSTATARAAPSSSTTSSPRRVTSREKFEERAKLQLQLYLIAVAEHWGAEPVGGLYHPLRGTSVRRPRGVVLDEAAGALASYRLYDNDLVDRAGLEETLAEARGRAGAIVARMRAGRSAAIRARDRDCAATTSARSTATSPRSAAARGRRSARRIARRRSH